MTETEYRKQEEDCIRREFGALKGATIEEVRPGRMDYGSEVVTEIQVTTRWGQRVTLQVWQDPEGNGPGHLCVTEASEPKKGGVR